MFTALALNLGSTSLKAARFCVEPGCSVPHALARIAVDAGDDGRGFATPESLAGVAAELGFSRAPEVLVHRIVHGGGCVGPLLLTEAVLARLEEAAQWAALHKPAALALVRAAQETWPRAESWAVFDTDWHHELPARSSTLPIPATLRARGMRRYGFHGLAFASAYRMLREADPAVGARNVVCAHLGGGSSLCAIRDGRSIDTSMALTPLSGLPMGTRSGSLDPGIVLTLQREGWSAARIETLLSRESGLLGIAGGSGDMRALLQRDDSDGRLAVELFVLSVAQGVAAMATSLGGLDDLVFSGGIGTYAAPLRTAIARRLGWLGAAIDEDANRRMDRRIDDGRSRCRIWVLRVDEETELAAAVATAVHH